MFQGIAEWSSAIQKVAEKYNSAAQLRYRHVLVFFFLFKLASLNLSKSVKIYWPISGIIRAYLDIDVRESPTC